MLSKEKKTAQMKQLSERIARAKASFLVNCIGLKAEQMTALRKDLKASQGEIQVIRNTLARLVLDKHPELKSIFRGDRLKGPNSFVLAFDEPAGVAKIIDELCGESPAFVIKSGFLHGEPQGESLTAEEVSVLAKLPPLPALRARFLGALSAPMAKFLGTLGGGARLFRAAAESPRGAVRILRKNDCQKMDGPSDSQQAAD